MLSVLPYKVALIVLLAASGSTAGLVYYYRGQTANLNSQVSTLNSNADSLRDQIGALRAHVENLTSQISQLQAVNSQLSQTSLELQSLKTQLADSSNRLQSLERQLTDELSMVQSLESQFNIQLTSLQSQLAQSQTEVAQLQALVAKLQAQLTSGLCSSAKTITIGELLDLSSALSTQGVRAKDGSALAISDINTFLSSAGCSLKFAAAVDDYALDNAKALTDLQSLATASGVQVVVGPLNNGAAYYLLSYANSNHIVLISPSSASAALAIPNDYLFRTVPNDNVQGLADARMLVDRGASSVIIVQRHDVYGDNLANAIANRFKGLGGHVIDTIQYDPSIMDFTAPLTALYNDFQSANSTYPNSVAIDVIAFEELGTMIIQANSQHPSLLNGRLPWFGTDGEAQDTVITGNATVGPLVAKVRLPSTLYAPVNNSKTVALYSRFVATYPGNICDSFCLGAYDDVWLAALATLQVGSYNGTKIQAVLNTVASNYYGVTGWMGLDPNGDRIAATYQIWKVVSQGVTAIWVLAGTWDYSTDSITWTSPP